MIQLSPKDRSPRISVAMPVFNGMPYLVEALDSLLAQTEPDFEIVAVDDGSTDATAETLARYARRDSRVRPIRRRHAGIVAALNAGLEAARAPLIARMDADDRCRPERLALQLAAFEADPALGLVASRVGYDGDADAHRGFSLYVDWSNELLSHDALFLNRFVESPLVHPTVMFRRELTARFGGYREGPFPEDYELWLRWLAAGVRMVKLPHPLVLWRERAGRLSRVNPRYGVDAFYELKAQRLTDWLQETGRADRVVIWGAGRVSRQRSELLTKHGVHIHAYIDIDPRKIGQTIHGRPVWKVADLPDAGSFFVLSYVGNRGARDLIREALEARGYRLGQDFLPAA